MAVPQDAVDHAAHRRAGDVDQPFRPRAGDAVQDQPAAAPAIGSPYR